MSSIILDEFGRVKRVFLQFGNEDETTEGDESVSNNSPEDQNTLDDIVAVAEPLQNAMAPLPKSPQKGTLSPHHSDSSVHRFLSTVPHLFTLSEEDIRGLDVMVREYSEMDIVVEEGTILPHIFVLASGTVEVINTRVGLRRVFGHRRVGSMTAPNIFGIDDAILEKPTDFSYHSSSSVTLILIPKQQFCDLLSRSAVFASSVSSYVEQTLSSFSVFEEFCRALFGLSSSSVASRQSFGDNGYKLSLSTIVDIYQSSTTTLHKLMHSTQIDTDALRYCVNRLPENVTETFVMVLSRTIPNFFAEDAGTSFAPSPGQAKRWRCTWRVGLGDETIIVVRDGFTDIIDIVTNLCMLIVESRKMRLRMQRLVSPSAFEILRGYMDTGERPKQLIKSVLAKLSFTEDESNGLLHVWGSSVLKTLHNILLHREEFVVHVDVNMSKKFAPDPYLNWCLSILQQMKKELGLQDHDDLPNDVTVDILLAPNVTVKTLLCSASEAIEPLLKEHNLKMEETYSSTTDDCFLYILSQLLEQDENARDVYCRRLESSGFTLMEDNLFSGITVDLIDVSKLCFTDMNSSLQAAMTTSHSSTSSSNVGGKRLCSAGNFIINIDRTFGSQIQIVLRSLVLTFGNYIRSVNVTGGVSGLVGKRGDIVLPTKLLFSKQSFGEDSTDETRVCNKDSLSKEDVVPFISDLSSTIHNGTCVTIPGTILHSRNVYHFYKALHGCTAVDMRSSYVARQMEESRRTGVLKNGVMKRYLFYTDAVPLENSKENVEQSDQDVLFASYATTSMTLYQRGHQTRALIPYLVDTGELITDLCIIEQLAHFSHLHRLGSPLWLTWGLTERLSLSLKHMQSPLNIWQPLMGEIFVPLIKHDDLLTSVMQKYPLADKCCLKRTFAKYATSPRMVLALSSSASTNSEPQWCSVEKELKPFFTISHKGQSTRTMQLRKNTDSPYACLHQMYSLWVSLWILRGISSSIQEHSLIRTPHSTLCLVNADQLYPNSDLLAEKELHCLLQQPCDNSLPP